MSAPARILIVDDFEPIRGVMNAILRQRPDYEIVGEAADGIEAVEKATQLQPDIILLDLGLPRLNGMEVARQIVRSCASKVVFVSQNTCESTAEAALNGYGNGYIAKADMARELLNAVDAVLRGGKYVPSRFRDRDWAAALNVT